MLQSSDSPQRGPPRRTLTDSFLTPAARTPRPRGAPRPQRVTLAGTLTAAGLGCSMTNSSPDEVNVDVVVIGAGTAGLAAAKSAHARGASVAIVDRGPLGTFCARLACMPSKAILQSTLELSRVRRAESIGVGAANVSFNWPVARARKSCASSPSSYGVSSRRRPSRKILPWSTGRLGSSATEPWMWTGRRSRREKVRTRDVFGPFVHRSRDLDAPAALAITSDDVFDLPSTPVLGRRHRHGVRSCGVSASFGARGARVHLIGSDDRIAGPGPGALQDAPRNVARAGACYFRQRPALSE